MAKIPDHIINEILDRSDIVEVISSYIPLKSAGRNFKAPCPFHNEKTPSFIVSPDKQIYHCFGCNAGGNVFNFIREYEKIDFIDAVKMLAEKAGVKLPEYKSAKNTDDALTVNIHAINDIAADFYTDALSKCPGSSPVRKYVEKRGIEDQVMKKFRLGYADPAWKSLLEYLLKRGIKESVVLKAGLIVQGKDGSFYDLFRNRLILPIFDVRGRVIGFGARVLDDSLPKYINSPETALYKKGRHLYGLNFAKSYIREKEFATITEGYLDVITSHQYGINNAISSLGTALTTEQIRALRRYTYNVVMVYDADQAGEMAALRSLDLFLEEGMNVKVAALDTGHDPDSFIRKFGPRGFNEAVKKAKSLFTYKLDILREKFDVNEPEGKAGIVKEMLSTIYKVRNAVIKAEYIKNLSNELSIKEEAIWEELRGIKKTDNNGQGAMDKKHGEKKSITISPAEKILTKLMLEDFNVVSRVKEILSPFDFKNSDVRNLIEALFNIEAENSLIDATKLINYLDDKVASNVISFIVNEDIEIRDKEKNIADCIMTIKRERRNERLDDIQKRLALAQASGTDEETMALLEEFNMLIKERK